jgi:hypothetical protein
VAEDPTVDPKDPRRKVRLPVELPAGLSAEGVGLMPAFAGVETFSARSSLAPRLLSSRSLIAGRGLEEEELRVARDADVLQLEGGVLVIEFPVPADRFCFPEDGTVQVQFPDGNTAEAVVIRDDSSPPGPHDEGLIVRMAFRLQGTGTWHHRHVTLRWTWKRGGFFRRRRSSLALVVRIDERFLPSGDCE